MSLLKLNVGSGQRKFDASLGWTNIDINAAWAPELVADCSSLPMLADASCSMIVSHHQLEHVDLTQADAMLAEWYRLLAPGGSLLIFVPDLRALADAWIEGRIDDFIYCVNLYGAFMGHEADRHKWGYRFLSLRQKLWLAGPWREIKKFDWRKVEGADIAAKDFWILGVEAVK
jgi:ubiquinone/menaquinone biosynthesis C-methylase UbiE